MAFFFKYLVSRLLLYIYSLWSFTRTFDDCILCFICIYVSTPMKDKLSYNLPFSHVRRQTGAGLEAISVILFDIVSSQPL